MRSKKLDNLSTAQMEGLIETLMWFWGNLHQRWRSVVEDEYGLDAVRKLELKLDAKVGRSHAKRIKKIFNIGGGLSGFVNAFRFVPENFVEDFEILEQTEKYIVFCNPSCSAQKARIREGKSEYPCKESAILYFTNFACEIDPNIQLSCIMCPPDSHPDNCYCKWRLEAP